jgi:hypothetical protein
MAARMPGWSLAASVALLLALPVGAQESSAPMTSIVARDEVPPTLTYDSDWKASADARTRRMARERDVEVSSIGLIGPAAVIFIVLALGITITVRSLRDDFRHQRTLNRYWRHGAMSRAKRASRD